LTAADESSLGAVLEGLRRRTRAEDVLCFPIERTFKASTVFVSGGQSLAHVRREDDEGERVEPLSESQKRVVALMEKSLPLETTPLLTVAERWGQPVELLIVQLRHWLATGAIRHFGAVLSPQKVGLPVAAMVTASGPKDRLDEAGQALAACAEVDQCHRHRSLADGGDLLIATIHGRSRENIQATLEGIAGRCRLSGHEVFFGESEYKDTPVRLFPASLPRSGGRRAIDLPDWMT
jgi:DNA-binding Lrp family transcriptional regulator